jgi:hypothetical protein
MEKSLVMTLPFDDPSWDGVLESWLQDSLDPSIKQRLATRLALDAKFREDFCEWVKSLRSPGESNAAQRRQGAPS